ncbi:SMP-30/gluconolactonase/LRE family protein [Rhodococcus sp. NPDC055112]
MPDYSRIEIIVASDAEVGEGPFWAPDSATVHWVDIPAGTIHSFELATERTRSVSVGTDVGSAVPRPSGGFVAGTADGFAHIDLDGRLHPIDSFLHPMIRMNDGKCDAAGRLWSGSTAYDFTDGLGALHVLDETLTCRTVLDGLTQPNGLGWSPDNQTFYLVDSVTQDVSAFDFHLPSATISRRRTLINLEQADGVPDGLAIDSAGCLWIALWGGGTLVQISPDGQILEHLEVPIPQPTSCAFIGAGLETLAVTSARAGQPSGGIDGSILAIHGLAVTGAPVSPFCR